MLREVVLEYLPGAVLARKGTNSQHLNPLPTVYHLSRYMLHGRGPVGAGSVFNLDLAQT